MQEQEIRIPTDDGEVTTFVARPTAAMADLPVYDEPAAERHFERTLELWRRTLQT